MAISAITSDRSREGAEPAEGGRSSVPVGKWRHGEHLHAVRADEGRLRAAGAGAGAGAGAVQSVAISGDPSEGKRRQAEASGGKRRQAEASGGQRRPAEASGGNQLQSVAISCNQLQSVAAAALLAPAVQPGLCVEPP